MRKHCALPSSSKYALHSKAMFILDWLFIYPYILNFQGRCRIMLIHGVQSKHHQMSWTSWNFEANGDLLALAASQRDSQCLILGPRGIPGGTEAYRWGTSRYPLFQHVSTYIYLVHPGPHFFCFLGIQLPLLIWSCPQDFGVMQLNHLTNSVFRVGGTMWRSLEATIPDDEWRGVSLIHFVECPFTCQPARIFF